MQLPLAAPVGRTATASITATRLLGAVLLAASSAAVWTPASAQSSRPAELSRLDLLIGSFEGEVSIERPGGNPITGRMSFEASWQLDSAWVVARYQQLLMGRSTSGLLMFSWNAEASEYMFYGFPNIPSEPNRLRGTFDANTLVFGSRSGAEPGAFRETWELRGSDTLVTMLSASRDGMWVAGPRTVLVRRR